jgi:hypothetical protein
MIHIGPRAACAHEHSARGRIHSHVLDRRQVDDQAVIADAQACGVVPPATDRNPQAVGFCHPNRGDHVGHIGALRDEPWPAIDHPVINFPRLLIRRILGFDNCAPELAAKFGDCLL